MPYKLESDTSIDTLWDEITYTEAALLGDTHTTQLASTAIPYINKVQQLRTEQWSHWRTETIAQAAIDSANYLLDATVSDFAEELFAAIRRKHHGWKETEARASSEYKLYFKVPPSDIIRLGLDSELNTIADWPARLDRETDPALVAYSAKFRHDIQVGERAIAKRNDATASTAQHRVQSIEDVIEQINTYRTIDLYTELLKISKEQHLPKSWVDLFYRKKDSNKQSPTQRTEARGKAQAVLLILSTRGIPVSEELQQKILAEKSQATLDQWIAAAVTVVKSEDLVK